MILYIIYFYEVGNIFLRLLGNEVIKNTNGENHIWYDSHSWISVRQRVKYKFIEIILLHIPEEMQAVAGR